MQPQVTIYTFLFRSIMSRSRATNSRTAVAKLMEREAWYGDRFEPAANRSRAGEAEGPRRCKNT